MENNNGRPEQEVDVQKLMEEKARLEQAANNLYARVQQLENTWMLNRANFLFKVIETPRFSEECKDKAIKELEGFLFPPEKKAKEGEPKEE